MTAAIVLSPVWRRWLWRKPEPARLTVLRPGQRVLQVPGLGVTVSRRAVSAAAEADWWEVAGKTCVAAYQAKAAASYAASLVNLASSGTYDLTEGSAPTWASATGWTFNGSSQYLVTAATLTDACSVLVAFSGSTLNSAQCVLIGNIKAGWVSELYMANDFTDANRYFSNSSYDGKTSTADAVASGVMGIAGKAGYYNGASEVTLPAGSMTYSEGLVIGCMDFFGFCYWFNGNIQAIALYSDTLTSGEVETVSDAMAAL